jgi:predicted ABC-type ATPase
MNDPPWLWLIAGPNGAGKSTYAPNLAANVNEIVRPDELAYRLSRDAPESVALSAGRLAVQSVIGLLKQRLSFAVETTLAGRFHMQVIERAKTAGWSIGVVYIGLGSSDLAIERVRQRVNQGGHYVPPHDVRRRYERSLRNLSAICQSVDRLLVFDNSSIRKGMKRVLEMSHGKVVFRQRRLPKWLGQAVTVMLRQRPGSN